MRDCTKTKAQLMEDLADLRQQLAELEAAATEGVRTEEALRKTLLERDTILNSLVELVVYQDTEMKILWANRAARESAGPAREELIGRYCYEVWPQRSDPCPDCPVVEAMETGQPQEVEKTTPDGRAWFVRGYPVRDESGDALGAVEVTLEITARKQAEEEMHRSLEEATRSRRLVLALSEAAQAMQRARTTAAVYRAIGAHALELGFDATVFTVSDDRTHLIVSYLSLKSDLVRAAEKLTGLSAEGYRFPLRADGEFQRAIAGEETVFSNLDVALYSEALPRLARPLAGRLAALFGWQQSIIAPLSVGDEVRGLLAISSTDLIESDVPAVTAFANQAAIALENALLYKETRQLAAFSESIIQHMSEGIVVQDAEGRFSFANPAAENLLGYAPDELVGLPGTAVIPADQLPIIQAADERRKSGRIDRYAVQMLRNDGRRVPVLVSGTPRTDAEGHFAGSVAVFTDITELKQAVEAQRASEDKMRSIFRVAPTGIGIVAPIGIGMVADRVLLEANPRIYEMTGYAKEELVGKSARMLYVSQEDFEFVGNEKSRQIAERGTGRLETRWQRKDGSIIHVLLASTPIDADDPSRGVTFTAQDITERRQAEKERELLLAQVRAQARQIQQTIDTVPEGVLLLDRAQRVILANPAAGGDLAVLTEAKVGDIITHLGGRPLAELLTSPPTEGLWHEVKAEGRTFEVIARPMENGPEPENWVLVIRDVTQERESERRRQQQERLAAVGQLAAGIAHDFNNIMAVIVLYTQMGLRMPDIPAQLRDRLQTVDQQARQATDLIQQILDFSRRAVLERRPMDLPPFLKEVVSLLERTVPESIKLGFTYGRDEYTVNADPTRVQQAIMNLVVNARDAMLPQGGGNWISSWIGYR